MPRRNPFRRSLCYRLQDRVDDRENRRLPPRHRRRLLSADKCSGREDDRQGTKAPLVDRDMGGGEVLERKFRCAHADRRSGVDRAAHLRTRSREVDSNFASFYCDLDLDRHRSSAIHTVVVEERFGLIGAVGNLLYFRADNPLGVLPALANDIEHGLAPIFVQQVHETTFAEATCRNLCSQVTEYAVWVTDVVAQDTEEVLVRRAGAVKLHGSDLDTLLKARPRVREEATWQPPTDVDPVSPNGWKGHELATVKHWGIDDYVV